MKLLNKAKVQMFLSLFGVALFAVLGNFSLNLVFRYLVILGFTLGLEYLLWKLRKIHPFLPSASFVTATIVFLLSEPSTPIYLVLLAPIFAVLQKQFIRPWGSHIFNPAGFGLLASAYFGNIVSWWGPNTNLITLLIVVLAAGYVSAIKVGQWKIILPFLLTSVLVSFIRSGNLTTALGQLTVGAFLFFSFVMLPEPATAAQNNITKPLYGIMVAIIPFLILSVPNIADLQLASLMAGDAAFKIVDKLLPVRSR